MNEIPSRRAFSSRLSGHLLVAWAVVALPGCGGGGGGYDSPAPAPTPAPAPAGSCGNTTISGNHGHVLVVPRADLDLAADQAYDIRGTSPHTHQVGLSAAQLAALKAGGTVTVTSSPGDGHTHLVSVSCA